MRSILFLCTANSARSILAEAIINARGGARFRGFSAGSKPRGVPNPVALELLVGLGLDTRGLRSKSWSEFADPDAPAIDAVITVCDNAKGETCPIFPGHPVQAHWGIPDPAGYAADGSHVDGTADGFVIAYNQLYDRIEAMLRIDEAAMSTREWRDALIQIGREAEGATHG